MIAAVRFLLCSDPANNFFEPPKCPLPDPALDLVTVDGHSPSLRKRLSATQRYG
jgi:hypothetical protein